MVDKKIRIVTHNGGFHADDVFGVSALLLLLGDKNVEIIRSREQSVIDSADYVLDVGFVYDASLKRFDHHQKEGGGKRENGIPYASFGLIWKYLGVQLCGSDEVADIVERSLVQAIDAYDNGYPLYDLKQSPDKPFLIQDALSVFEPVDGEDITLDDQFLKAVSYARVVLERVIMHARQQLEVRKKIKELYEQAEDKRVIVFDDDIPADRTTVASLLGEYPDTLYFVRKHEDNFWQLSCVINPPLFYDNRKLLPIEWGGKRGEELARITGVSDSVFCHSARFMIVTNTKESALSLAKQVLDR